MEHCAFQSIGVSLEKYLISSLRGWLGKVLNILFSLVLECFTVVCVCISLSLIREVYRAIDKGLFTGAQTPPHQWLYYWRQPHTLIPTPTPPTMSTATINYLYILLEMGAIENTHLGLSFQQAHVCYVYRVLCVHMQRLREDIRWSALSFSYLSY